MSVRSRVLKSPFRILKVKPFRKPVGSAGTDGGLALSAVPKEKRLEALLEIIAASEDVLVRPEEICLDGGQGLWQTLRCPGWSRIERGVCGKRRKRREVERQ